MIFARFLYRVSVVVFVNVFFELKVLKLWRAYQIINRTKWRPSTWSLYGPYMYGKMYGNLKLYIDFVRSLYGPYRGSYKVLIWSVYNSKYAMVVLTYHNFKSFFKKLVDLLQQGTCLYQFYKYISWFVYKWMGFSRKKLYPIQPLPLWKTKWQTPLEFQNFSFFLLISPTGGLRIFLEKPNFNFNKNKTPWMTL